MWYSFHIIWLLFNCSLLGVISFLLLFSFFRLGADDIIEGENIPQQPLEHNQQGKQFDHSNPIIFKFIFVYNLYVCMAILLSKYG